MRSVCSVLTLLVTLLLTEVRLCRCVCSLRVRPSVMSMVSWLRVVACVAVCSVCKCLLISAVVVMRLVCLLGV